MRRIFMLAVLVAACGRSASNAEPPPTAHAPSTQPAPAATPAPPPAQPAAPATPPDYKRSTQAMGTIIAVTVVGVEAEKAAPAVDAAFAEIDRLERLLSEWRPDSEISQINAAAGVSAVKVSPETLAVIRAANDISRWSQGAFDLSWAALRGMYTFQHGETYVPDLAEVKKRLKLIDYRKIKIDERAGTVKLLAKGMVLGTGGITKGYALDRAADVLRAAGIANYMFFGGGQIELGGTRSGRPWRVGIQHPRVDDYFAFLEVTDGSVATAGDYEHAFVKDGKRWHHIIDTKTGLPVPHTSSVTVVAESGLAADAVDTAIFILGAERALKMIESAPFPVDAIIVDSEMRVHMTPGMEKRIVMRAKLEDGKLPLPPGASAQP